MGAEDYLSKPPNPVLLRARIGASLEKKRLRDQQRELVRKFATAEVAEELLTSGFELVIRFPLAASVTLTARELEVLQLLAEGLSNKEMARALGVAPRTINFHLDNLYSKLSVSSRTEAAIYALRRGWVRKTG